MTTDAFIFSNKTAPRFSRHLAFWAVFIIYLFLFRFYLKEFQEIFLMKTYVARVKSVMLFLPLSFGYAYFALYFLLPNYILKGRYLRLLLIVCVLSILLLIISHLISPVVDIRTVWDFPNKRDAFLRSLDFATHNVVAMPLTVSGFAIGIKMTKDWYLKQKEKEELEKQKLKTELQLQKMQLHPRFLFHSLNRIYIGLTKDSNDSAPMLLKLSYILSYLLYETEEERVPLAKELQMVRDYVELAQAGYSDYFYVHIDDLPNIADQKIAPLLLLPLLEYIFARNFTDDPVTLSIKIKLENDQFLFAIRLQAQSDILHEMLKQKDDFLPVQKRLQDQYHGKYSFSIHRQHEELNLSLSLQLEKEKNLKPALQSFAR